MIRLATPADYAAVAALTVAAYRADGQTRPDHPYERALTDVGKRAAGGSLLVAELDGAVAGAVLFVLPDSDYAELSQEGEAEFRMLAVAPEAQGRGVGEALVRACLDRARESGCKSVVISVNSISKPAQRLYGRLGFAREPGLDWTPIGGVHLLGLRFDL
jgi:ribosomal protein S18 acetylase RimI-like enzyme